MRRHLLAGFAVAMMTTFPVASGASASEKTVSVMPLGYRVIAPAGFRAYCRSNPSDCVSTHALPSEEPVVEGDALTQANSFWHTAFSQVRAERGFPTGSVRLPRQPQPAVRNWREGLRPALAPSIRAEPTAETDTVERASPSSPQAVVLTPAMRRVVNRVNQAVNAAIRPARDESMGRGDDFWGARTGGDGTLYGDCEDYVLAKRKALLDEGLPAEALSIAVARNTEGQSHAVLILSTDRGDLVLDNLSYWIREWSEVPYQWIMRQNHGDATDWRSITRVDKAAERFSRGSF